MQHDHVLKKMTFDLLNHPPGSGAVGGSAETFCNSLEFDMYQDMF